MWMSSRSLEGTLMQQRKIRIPGCFKLDKPRRDKYNTPEVWEIEVTYYGEVCHDRDTPWKYVSRVIKQSPNLEFYTHITGWHKHLPGVRIG